ncbi:hypothetical protein GUJ93_ZPchr0002g26374 [Zizania palustris]|uniref:Calmodulin-binding domain-containing protein n=1 Tax=Zizania palustris TaxID=103762 RepID=A0A8J5S4W7_ZIZPA|nr:hypothetical protein GUJ93_ZPchr0002g26374 [Zizania palustris]
MRVNQLEPMASPPPRPHDRALPRSASGKAPSSSPLIAADTYSRDQPASTPTTPAAASGRRTLSITCMHVTSDDAPPATPSMDKVKSSSLWSPRKLMQRASNAFWRGGRSRRRKSKDNGDGVTSVITSKGSEPATVLSLDGIAAEGVVYGDGARQEEQHDDEVVPEKIIHEANAQVASHQPPVVVEEKEGNMKAPEKEINIAFNAAVEEEEHEEDPKKAAAAPVVAADVALSPLSDKFIMLVKEAMAAAAAVEQKKTTTAATDELVWRGFQGSRVKTAMEKRTEEEQPRRREVARSNDVIEEARSKLLQKRQCSKVKALVGAFETVMDAKHVDAGKPQLHRPRR